jgi:hypothetical protein
MARSKIEILVSIDSPDHGEQLLSITFRFPILKLTNFPGKVDPPKKVQICTYFSKFLEINAGTL